MFSCARARVCVCVCVCVQTRDPMGGGQMRRVWGDWGHLDDDITQIVTKQVN
jgi:hypothetical protein